MSAISMWIRLGVLAVLAGCTALGQSPGRVEPRFEDYPTTETFRGAPAPPVLITSEQRLYRTRIRKGVVNGEGVWSGSWENTMKTSGPNFAGHYFVIRWGCGSDCLMMAVVDAKTGKVYDPPLSGAGTELYVNMDMLGDRVGIPVKLNACSGGKPNGVPG
jgi:hypothetical protein